MEKISIARRRWEQENSACSFRSDEDMFSSKIDAQASDVKAFPLHSLATFLIDKFNILQTGKKQFMVEIISGLGEKNRKLLVSLEPLASDSPAKDFISVEEAAQTLRVSKKTIYRQIQEGSLKGMKVGREWRVSLKSIGIAES